jgi:3-oxoacyl-[acyl-carrier-protein] synthase II
MERSDQASRGQTVTLLRDLMRPYDRRAAGLNYGNGAITLVLESREHAQQRAASIYGRVLGQATTRNAQPDLSIDITATAPIAAVRKCLGDRVTPEQIDYVNGGAQGDRVFNHMESTIISTVFGRRAEPMPVSVQEGCFGHSGAVLGNLGVAATLLMMRHGQVCPTTGCEQPDEALTFDPLPGDTTRPLRIGHAVSLNYTIGSVASAVLLGSEEA